MVSMRRCALVFALFTIASCRERSLKPAASHCPAGWRSETGTAAAFSVCIPRDFARVGSDSNTWGHPDSLGMLAAMISIDVRDGVPEDYNFPRSLKAWTKPRNCVDCVLATALQVVADTIGHRVVTIETAELGPGEAGGGPALFASWQVGTGEWVMVVGRAEERANLNTLRAIVRTLRVRGDSVSDVPDQPPNER